MAERIGVGFWKDANGDLHVSCKELLDMADLEDTAENRAKVRAIIEAVFRKKCPNEKLIYREQRDGLN